MANRVALVTGSSSGIGEQIARRLAAVGASVMLKSASLVTAGERLVGELGNGAAYIRADISDPAQVQRMIDAVIQRLGKLDVLASILGTCYSSSRVEV